MGLDLFEKIINTYERKARLYPALLVLATFGVFYLAASIVRELGKRIEESLFREWGGKPTTQLLRHRDNTIDPITKARYHLFLAKHMSIAFPTNAEEEADPTRVDDVYQSATKWLLDRTRDKKTFELLFEENIAFGFRRNCLGIKPLAIVICVVTFVWPLFLTNIFSKGGLNIEKISSLSNGAWVSLGVSLLMLLIWVFFFTKETVKTAAFGYADFLFRACDILPKKR